MTQVNRNITQIKNSLDVHTLVFIFVDFAAEKTRKTQFKKSLYINIPSENAMYSLADYSI